MPDPAGAAPGFDVEVIYAEPERSHRFVVRLAPGSTVGDALDACSGLVDIAGLVLPVKDVGVFGQRRALGDPVQAGDRIEIYRPLAVDPKQARRRRAGGRAA